MDFDPKVFSWLFGQVITIELAIAIAVVRGFRASCAASWGPVMAVDVLEGAAMALTGVAIPRSGSAPGPDPWSEETEDLVCDA